MDSPCSQVEFSPIDTHLLGAACDTSLALLNVESQKVIYSFTKEHRGAVKSLAFSPLNRILLSSVGVDRNVCFYDISQKVLVKKIQTDVPLSKIAFSSDGHTIALGSTSG